MDFPCSECEYNERCFQRFILLKWFFSHLCQQGRKKKKPQTKIGDFTGTGSTKDEIS